MVWIPPPCIQLYSQQSDQQLYPQDRGQSVKIMNSKLTPWCRIFKLSVHCYSAGQNIPAVMVNKGLSVCEIWGSYSGDSFKFTIFWDVVLCRLGFHYPHFGGTCCLHLSDRQNELADYTAPHATRQYSLFITTFTKCILVALSLHVKCLMFLFDFNWIWIFSTYLQKFPISNFMEIHPLKVTLIHANRWTDVHAYQS